MRFPFPPRSIAVLLPLLFLLSRPAPAQGLGPAQGIGIDAISFGPLAVHDRVSFDFHTGVKDDPYPHEFKQGYAYDGVDLGAAVDWHWNRTEWLTSIRVTPASRNHFAYDQDTDFEPGNNYTHGDAGRANSRTFGVGQRMPVLRSRRLGAITYDVGFLRQWTRFNQVTTYDLNTDPALPSASEQRVISERAIVYELRSTVSLERERQFGAWRLQGNWGVTPLSEIFLRNYIPTVLAADSTPVYGVDTALGAGREVGDWGIRLSGDAGWYESYLPVESFRRETFALRLELQPPRFW